MDEVDEPQVASVGQRLRAAREEKGLSLEDVASQTRIPRRHLEALEDSAWDRLPAPTYTIGFAKSYASAIGLDRSEVGEQLRGELGGTRPVTTTETFEPADPARTMPKWLVFAAVGAVILLVVLMSWLNDRSLESEEPAANQAATSAAPQAASPTPAPAPQAAPQGPVVLTATAPVWIQVTDQGRSLFQGELAQGQRFEVPATATAPVLKAGKPEALQVTVGGATAPQVGPPGRVASNVSLAPADLMRGPGGAAPPGAPAPNSTTQPTAG